MAKITPRKPLGIAGVYLITCLKPKQQVLYFSSRDIFQKNGKFLELGDILRRPVYAKTLEEIGESGSADIFYTGKYASTIVREINDKGGIMKLDDLMEYEARNVTPLFTNLGDLKILAAPPPAGCAVLINILKILKGKENTFHNNHSDPSYQYKSCLVKKKEKKRKKRKKRKKKKKKEKKEKKKKKKEKKKERKKKKKKGCLVR